MNHPEVLIIGAGAAGLMCAIEAGKRGRRVLVVDHANKVGKKILMSGGGRCNFTNYYIAPEKYLSNNPQFCISALSRYTQWDFIELVQQHQIPFHEKTLGQLFCDHKSKDIVAMLLNECQQHNVQIKTHHSVSDIEALTTGFRCNINGHQSRCQSLVIATGGLSIPTMGASPFGYQVAEQFNLPVLPTRAGLVPFTLHTADKERLAPLSGISVQSEVANHRMQFTDNILFTHRGISGPAALQMSSYWLPGEVLNIDLLPDIELMEHLKGCKISRPKALLKTVLSEHLPQRVVERFIPEDLATTTLANLSHQGIERVVNTLQPWQLKPNATEGYRTAEVTLGGVDTTVLSSKTLAVKEMSNLYFIGEVVDVTGWLGGYNFQWAWSSGWAAGQVA